MSGRNRTLSSSEPHGLLTGQPDFISAVCDGPRSFAGIEWGAVLAFRGR